MTIKKVIIEPPADVPTSAKETYIKNYLTVTKQTGKLFIFACDQKIEHLNEHFVSDKTTKTYFTPDLLFEIAHKGTIGAMATQLGLIARYGNDFKDISYIVKLNSKTNIRNHETHHDDPISLQLWSVDQVAQFKKNSGLSIAGIGYTVYLGSKYENQMLSQAAQAIYQAHQQGMLAILWMYPRGSSVPDDREPSLIQGAAGVANALGADFVKIKSPHKTDQSSAQELKAVVAAAGNTKVLCAGGSVKDSKEFLKELKDQIVIGGTGGCAIGRNIFKSADPVAMTHAIAQIIYDKH